MQASIHNNARLSRSTKVVDGAIKLFVLMGAWAYCQLSRYSSLPAAMGDKMPLNRTRILCIGKDPTLLASRCGILNNEGYDAKASNVDGGFQVLQAGNFDVVILSGTLAKKHGEFVSDCPTNTQSLVIEGFLFPSQLLAALKQKLERAA